MGCADRGCVGNFSEQYFSERAFFQEESMKKRNRRKPTTHSEHRLASELTDNFGDTFVRLEDAKERLFSVTLPDESEQRETVQLVAEFCPKDVFNCRSRCQYESCGGCVHMFSCTCWNSTSNGGVLCRHCHAVLPWARAFLKISSSDIRDEGIRAEDVMTDEADNDQGSDDASAAVTVVQDGLAASVNNGDREEGVEEEADGDICMQASSEAASLSELADELDLPSSSRRLLTMTATQNAIRTTNDENPIIQSSSLISVQTCADDATTSNVAADRPENTPSYYMSDFDIVRQQLIQALQDKIDRSLTHWLFQRLGELPEDVKRELCGSFSELTAVMHNYIWQIRKKGTFVRILGYIPNTNTANASLSPPSSTTSTVHPLNDKNTATTSEGPLYASPSLNQMVSFGRIPQIPVHQPSGFIRTAETSLNALTEPPPQIVIAHESELVNPPPPIMIREASRLPSNPPQPRLTREAEIVRRLRGSSNNVMTIEARIVKRLKDESPASMESSISSTPSPTPTDANGQRRALVVTGSKDFKFSEIKEECERIEEVAIRETPTVREKPKELGEEGPKSNMAEPIGERIQANKSSEHFEDGVTRTQNDAQSTVSNVVNSDNAKVTDWEGQNKMSAFVKLEISDSSELTTAETSMMLPPSTSQQNYFASPEARQYLGHVINVEVDKCSKLFGQFGGERQEGGKLNYSLVLRVVKKKYTPRNVHEMIFITILRYHARWESADVRDKHIKQPFETSEGTRYMKEFDVAGVSGFVVRHTS
ncbi:unnamed protein product [Toxocara canis]|uniref:RING-type domain-containing protein n=1 Tax=Toxocara canis TaxID=6265 RepID=A0A183V4E1_TOXCA|nr:unnamed protein product [Toxocara canis]